MLLLLMSNIAWVTVLFGTNSTSDAIEIAQSEAECYFNCFISYTLLYINKNFNWEYAWVESATVAYWIYMEISSAH